MIDYHQFSQIKDLHQREGLHATQISEVLSLDPRTVTYWLGQERFRPRKSAPRPSKLDPFKPRIRHLLERYPYSAAQIWQRLREQGFEGGYSMVKAYVRTVRPSASPPFSHSPLPRAKRPKLTGVHMDRCAWDKPTGA